MDERELLTTIASILDISFEELDLEAKLEHLGFDSISSLSLIAHLDLKGISIAEDELNRCETIGDLARIAGAQT